MDYDENRNLIEDNVDDIAKYLEEIYSWYKDEYKINMPWSGAKNNRMAVIVGYLDPGTLGEYHFIEGDGPYFVVDPVQLANINELSGDSELKGTIAHEMFHAITNAYIPAESLLKNNFAEGMAVMLQSKLWRGGESYLNFDEYSPKQNPSKSIFGIAEAEDATSYGSYLWYSFLHQKYGKTVVENLVNELAILSPDNTDVEYITFLTVDNALATFNANVTDAYIEFSKWNYDKGKYVDGSKLRKVDIAKTHSGFVNDFVMPTSLAPSLFGSNYIEFDVSAINSDLQVDFIGNSDAKFALSFLVVEKDGSVDVSTDLTSFVDIGSQGEVRIPYVKDWKKLVMIVSPVDVTNIETADIFNDYVYSYIYSLSIFKGVVDVPVTATLEPDDGNLISFSDLPTYHPNAIAIMYLKENGIINGYPDGTFKPENAVNRAELLKMVIEGKGITPSVQENNNCFKDINGADWFVPYVCYAKSADWIDGYPDGTFKPAQIVNKVEAIKILLNSQEIDVPTTVTDKPFDDVNLEDWFAPYVFKAKELEILEEAGNLFSGSEGMTRAGISENLYRLLIKLSTF